ncbi:MAG: TonB-dependent siderophore receptor, partial [Pseudomonadota bacterium]|nr:TonB-dependent siderophore receptor [Pseudomonadota bacterium]
MSRPHLKYSVLAFAVMQAFGAVSAQTMPEVVITGAKSPAGERAAIGGFADAPLLQTPASISTIERQQMQDFGIHNSTEAMKLDASVSDAYNAVGYAENFSIRGFALDNTSSYRKDGLAIPGDTQIPLENKERIEVLKGLAGLQAGVAAPGGIINYVTKRPTNADLRSVTLEVRERGTLYGALDLGGRFADKRFGYRINAAGEKLRSYVKGADGKREFVSGAFDWQITPDALLQLDLDYQHKSQLTVPGYQLIRNVSLPTGISQTMLLNDQPWARPVDTNSTNAGLRFEYRFDDAWSATVSMNKHWFKRDDYTAFPYGCSNEGAGYYPGYCSNGDYDVYDYQSAGEKKSPFAAQAMVQGKFATGAVRHQLTLGSSLFTRSDKSGDYVYDYVGSSNIYHNVIVPSAPASRTTGPVFERRSENERALFAQDIAALSAQWKLHAGLRYVQVKRDEYLPDDNSGVANAPRKYAHSDEAFALPNLALVYSMTPDWNLYGALSHGLEHGGIAPLGTTNNNTALAPSRSKQVEFGIKGAIGNDTTLSAALFQIRKGHEFTNGAKTYVRAGDETHRGLELSLQGRASADIQYGFSLLALHTEQQGTGQLDFDGKRVTDVPNFKSSAWLDYAVPAVAGLKLNAAWQYSGAKTFDLANTVNVHGYHLFDLGAAYATRVAGASTTLRFGVNNVFDKFYWRDVTPALGGYLLTGAPRTLRASAQFD